MEVKYYEVLNYPVKCRLYPNKEQREKIDRFIHGVHVAHNVIMYDMLHNFKNTNEKIDKNTGDVVHFPNFNEASKASYLNELKKEYPIIKEIPSAALTSKNGLINTDLKKRIISQTKDGVNKTKKGSRPVEYLTGKYYNKSQPRRSYTYQETLSKFTYKTDNVIKINLAKIGEVKVRGFNKDIRFDSSCMMTFKDYIELNPRKKITTTVLKDKCDDYWIVFKFTKIYKPIREEKNKTEVGVDVGVHDLIITSGGIKYGNCKFKEQEKVHIEKMNKKLSRRYGYANKKFREENKKSKEDGNGLIKPSNGYLHTKIKLARIHRKIAWKRNTYNNNITFDLVSKHSFIGIETLSVTDMYKKKDGETNRQRANRTSGLADASMSSILQMIKYKSEWYDRICQPINRWIPSSKKCHVCGNIKKDLTLNDRQWMCPVCGTYHDRDVNAAINILIRGSQDLGLSLA